MKIRIKGNSVRYRLTKSEVETFCKNGFYKEETRFGNGTFIYAIKADSNTPLLDANFEEDTITMYLNKELSLDWDESDQVGFNTVIQKGNGLELSLLLEKDFVCMDNMTEDQSDNYPNPKLL